MKMNLPNRLTCLRVILIPFFVVFMMLGSEGMFPVSDASSIIGGADGPTSVYIASGFFGFPGEINIMRIIACVIFCGASFTDFLDGYLARKNNLVTNFGKFMDPLADKLLVCSALILITVYSPYVPVWVTLIIIAREFIISGFRLVASDNGIVIAASKWGKLKTVSQMFLCIFGILNFTGIIFNVLVMLSLVLTVVSLTDYILKNIEVLTRGGM